MVFRLLADGGPGGTYGQSGAPLFGYGTEFPTFLNPDGSRGFPPEGLLFNRSDARALYRYDATLRQWLAFAFNPLSETFVNVKTYGAKGDGATDDTTAIAAALVAGLGSVVFFPAGTYITTRWRPGTNTTVVGVGPASLIKLKNGANDNLVEIFVSGVNFSSLKFDGNKANQSVGSVLVFSGATDCGVDNVWITNSFNNGISYESTSLRGRVRGSRIDASGGHGLSVSSSDDILALGNIITDSGSSGINFSGTLRSVAAGNDCQRSTLQTTGFAGVRLSNTAKHCTVTGNTIKNHSRGIFVTSSSVHSTIIGNTIDGSGGEGILLEGVVVTDLFLTCNGNLIRNAGQNSVGAEDGIRVSNGSFITMTGNTIVDDQGSATMKQGIKATGSSDHLTVNSNVIKLGAAAVKAIDCAAVVNSQIWGNDTSEVLTVASAATITLKDSGTYFNVTGVVNVTSVTASWNQRTVALRFSGILTFTDGSNLNLNGNFVTAAGSTITLVCDAGTWYEMARTP